MKILKSISVLCMGFLLLACQANKQEEYKYEYLYKDLPFEMPRVQAPVFPNNKLSLSDVGGVPDGETLNTEAFAKGMSELSAKGGGTLVVPEGIWYTGPITFQSNINLHLEKGALILFSDDFDLYPLISTSFEGLETKRCQSPISGRNLENIAITGQGSINGSGGSWRPVKKGKVTEEQWKALLASGGVVEGGYYWFPTEGAHKGFLMSDMNVPTGDLTEEQWNEIKLFLRPVMVSFVECKNVLLQDVLFENSPSWNIHPLMCENVILDNLIIRNPSYAQNGDGLDLESCKNSIIVDCTFDVGDDGICIKSGKDEDGRKRGLPTENVIVDNCKVFKAHGGFVVGSEMSGGVKNISVTNCQFLGTDVGLRFKSRRGRGGVVENIYVSDIQMFNIATESFLFDLYYGGKSALESLVDGDETPVSEVIPSVDETTPVFRKIYVKNLTSRNARRAMFFNGLPEMNISDIHVENVTISSQIGAELVESKDISFKNVKIVPAEGPALILKNVQNMNVEGFTFPETLKEVVNISGEKSQNINLPASVKEDLVQNSSKSK
ncbi:glycoside hydrolase family 28 protein [Dysgonomonas macrotermitis]|nr:glycoside hydrolase family 28 protein [Dysgonomonas macrotermitis]